MRSQVRGTGDGSERAHLVGLRRVLAERFDESELRTYCFDLGLDYDDLPSGGKSGKAREIVAYFERHDLIDQLVQVGRRLRPDIPWDELAEATEPGSARPTRQNLPGCAFEEFVDREQELDRVRRLLLRARGLPVIVITGIAGVGKSALALEVAYRCVSSSDWLPSEVRPRAIIWASATSVVLTAEGLARRRPVTCTLSDLLRAIESTYEREDIALASPEEQEQRVRRLLSQHRTLLVVDGLEAVQDTDVWMFLRELPPPSKALVTSRRASALGVSVHLRELRGRAGLALINAECRWKALKLTRAQKRRLLDLTGGVPLAIVWSMARIAFGYSVDRLLDELADIEPDQDIARFCFTEAVSTVQSAGYQALLSLSLFQCGASREALYYVLQTTDKGLDDALVQLQKLSLVDRTAQEGRERYSMLPLTRQYALGILSREPSLEQTFRDRMAAFFLKFVVDVVSLSEETTIQDGERYWASLFAFDRFHMLDREWDNIRQVIQRATASVESLRVSGDIEQWRLAVRTVTCMELALAHYLSTRGLWDEREVWLEHAADAAHELGWFEEEAWARIDGLGWIGVERGRFDEALRQIEMGEKVARAQAITGAEALGSCWRARAAWRMGGADAKEVMALYRRGLEQATVLLQDPAPTKRTLVVGARLYAELGRFLLREARGRGDKDPCVFEEIQSCLEMALSLRERAGEKGGLWPLRMSLASVLAEKGLHVQALQVLEEAHRYEVETLGRPRNAALVELQMARVRLALGYPKDAHRLVCRAMGVFLRLGMEEEIREAEELLNTLRVRPDEAQGPAGPGTTGRVDGNRGEQNVEGSS